MLRTLRAWGDLNKHQEKVRPGIAGQVVALSSEDLLNQYTYFAGGDDYDGCYSIEGEVVWEELQKELNKRLVLRHIGVAFNTKDDEYVRG